MIDIDVIEQEIHDIEARGDTTYAQCQRLSWLYIVRDHLAPKNDSKVTPKLKGSEFVEIASGVSFPALMEILDEHMEMLKVLYPKSYEAVISKIKALKNI